MAQERYYDWQDPLISLDENYRILGLCFPGVYAGFDTFEVVSGTLVKMKHTTTGLMRLALDGLSDQGPFGVLVTRQGVICNDDTEVQINLPLAVTNPRIDTLVASNTYIDSPGGSPVVYSLIAGAESTNAVVPAISNPLTQIKLGHFIVYPGADHAFTIFVRSDVKKLGGKYAFEKRNEEELNLAPEKDFNKVQRSGVYFMDNVTLNRPTTANVYWTLWVFKYGTRAVQMALDQVSGKLYARAAITFTAGNVTAWGSWINMNNVDVPGVDLGPINAAIGSRTYTEDNYVTDSQSLTASIDALDIALKDVDLILDQAIIDIDNLETAIGTRNYTEDNKLTDAESITASLDKIDKAYGWADNTKNLNNFNYAGEFYVAANATNAPVGMSAAGIMTIVKNGVNLIQRVADIVHGAEWTRTSSNTGSSWSAWTLSRIARKKVNIGFWNMHAGSGGSNVVSVPHGLTDGTKIEVLHAMILSDDSAIWEPIDNHSVAGVGGGISDIDNTDVQLYRTIGGVFDSALYNDPAFNRGVLYIEFIPH